MQPAGNLNSVTPEFLVKKPQDPSTELFFNLVNRNRTTKCLKLFVKRAGSLFYGFCCYCFSS